MRSVRGLVSTRVDDGALRGFLRLPYATVERVGGAPFGSGMKPNYFGAHCVVNALIALNIWALIVMTAKVARLPISNLFQGAPLLAVVVVCAALCMWLTRGLENSPKTDALRTRIDAENRRECLVCRSKIGVYMLGSCALLLVAWAT